MLQEVEYLLLRYIGVVSLLVVYPAHHIDKVDGGVGQGLNDRDDTLTAFHFVQHKAHHCKQGDVVGPAKAWITKEHQQWRFIFWNISILKLIPINKRPLGHVGEGLCNIIRSLAADQTVIGK